MYMLNFIVKVMAEVGSNNENIDELSQRLSRVHLDLMDEDDNYV